MLQIIDYSERCVAVLGTSKDNMEQRAAMKSMKGKWNPNLKNVGGGWVFSKRKNGEEVTKWVAMWNAAHPADAQPSAPQTPAPPKPQPTPATAPSPQPQSRPEPTSQAVEQPAAQTITQAPATISIPIIEDELEGAPF